MFTTSHNLCEDIYQIKDQRVFRGGIPTYLQLSFVSTESLPLIGRVFHCLLFFMLCQDIRFVFLMVGSQLGKTGVSRLTGLFYL
ncbi:hypothetical protein DPMN_075475 [Dreissena polymorpha]|uniref:Uncharacterized protein n=1 Tax=Dreissena polymorpha TaxID=45954 RepID=A0A9D3YL51_DREPO|nr:hypothetical protein DPMN_075475 [Dreissena polymorpha]